MMRTLVLAIVMSAAIAPSASGESPQATTVPRLEDDWRLAQHKNDTAAMLALLAPDVTFIGTSGSLRDRADFIASRTTSQLPRSATYEYSELRARVFGSVVVVTG